MGSTCCANDVTGNRIVEEDADKLATDYMMEASELREAGTEVEAETAEAEAGATKTEAEAAAAEADKRSEAETIVTTASEAARNEAEKVANGCEFTIHLKKNDPSSDKVGWAITKLRRGDEIVVSSPEGDPLEQWHKSNPTKCVLPGDEIMSVCGVSGSATAILDALRENTSLDIVLRRQLQITVEITKEGSFGLVFDLNTARIRDIHEGPFKDYNNVTSLPLCVYPSELLSEINGVLISRDNLGDELARHKDGDKVKFVFKRPAVLKSPTMKSS